MLRQKITSTVNVYQAILTVWEIKEGSQGNNLSCNLKNEYELVTRDKERVGFA